jgi:site-specific DNA recombinase
MWKGSSLKDTIQMSDLFKNLGVSLRSLTEQFESGTHYGELTLQMLGAAAELEREQISENVRSGMLERSKQGNWNSGNNVLGYRPVRNEAARCTSAEILPEEAEIVRSIFNMYASCELGFKAITNRLNAKGLLTKTGKPFGIHSVKGILLNRNYIGMIRYSMRKTPGNPNKAKDNWAKGHHQPIIAQALWDQVHSIYAQRSKPSLRLIERQFLLTGLLKCPQCGQSMVAGHTKSVRKDGSVHIHHYYVCGTFNTQGSHVCKSNAVRADEIERWFLRNLQKLLSTKSILDRFMASAQLKHDEHHAPLRKQLRELQAQLHQFESQQKEAFLSFENGNLSEDTFMEALSTIKQERQAIQQKLEHTEDGLYSQPSLSIPIEKIQATLQELHKVLNREPFDRQRSLLRLLVEKITLPPDRNVRQAVIHGKATLNHIEIQPQGEASQ